jgi:hypothetical protein
VAIVRFSGGRFGNVALREAKLQSPRKVEDRDAVEASQGARLRPGWAERAPCDAGRDSETQQAASLCEY